MLSETKENIHNKILNIFEQLKSGIFGQNNERIDFVMDTFYKLDSKQRNIIVGVFFFFLLLISIGTLSFYFTKISSLDEELNKNYQALHQFRTLISRYKQENKKFLGVIQQVKRHTRGLRPKSFFENLSARHKVVIEELSEKFVPISSDNPMSKRLKELVVEIRFSKISIPKLMKFLVSVDKSKKLFRLKDLQLRSRYGTKLYFDAVLKIKGFS